MEQGIDFIKVTFIEIKDFWFRYDNIYNLFAIWLAYEGALYRSRVKFTS